MLEAAVLLVFPSCMVYAAVSDMVSMTIANRIPALLVAAFLVLAALAGTAWPQIGMHLAAGTAVLAVTFVIFALGGMGGGDAKLIAATSVWFGFSPALMHYMVFSALTGGVLALALLAFRKSPLAAPAAGHVLLRHMADEKAGVPYGIALGAGGLLAFGQTPLAQWALAGLSAQ